MIKSASTLLAELRALMKSKTYVGQIIDAYLVPTTDPHRNEYVADRYKRREFLSKFTGSNGTAVVTDRHALLWTDGRYFQQAEEELDRSCWTLMREGNKDVPNINKWLIQNLSTNSSIGFDPELVSIDELKQWRDALEQSNLQLIPIETNFIDLIWGKERPALPSNPIWSYPIAFAGLTFNDKVQLVRNKLNELNVKHLIVHRTDDIAWLFNLRGGDIPFNPVFLSFAIVSFDSVQLFVETKKLSSSVKELLEKDQIEIHPYEEFYRRLKQFHQSKGNEEKFCVSPSGNVAVQQILPQNQLYLQNDLVYELKAKKTASEIEAMRRAHIKDAVALCSYLHWLEENIDVQPISECSGAAKLKSFRREQELFVEESFDCISAVGSHGAIIHYRPRKETDRNLTRTDLYLVDSGGQYLDGTTDVTRTIHLGDPTPFEKECFTRVLKGMMKLSALKYPPQTIGARLDSFARSALWEVGLDYQHGTGHGVGCCLNVHEGPQSIGTRIRSETFLVPGMILSDEPGVYLTDRFGIRIENLVLVTTIPTKYAFYNEDWLTFEHLTLVPIQLKLIDRNLLTDDEIVYLNSYHDKVRREIGDEMQRQGKDPSLIDWLHRNTEHL